MTRLVAVEITKSFPTAPGTSLEVIRGVSLDMDAGKNVAILGPSGSGKSTLLAILGTLDNPTSGSLELDGVNPFDLPEPELATFRSRKIGFVFQDHHLLPQCTVLENVVVPFLADGSVSSEQLEQAKSLIDRVGLAERTLHRPPQLSGGEKQRVAIARALVRRPALLLADEPTGNLDQSTAEEVSSLLLELQNEQQSMMVVVTHSDKLAERMQSQFVIDRGKLQACG